jgi:hypothetical protein
VRSPRAVCSRTSASLKPSDLFLELVDPLLQRALGQLTNMLAGSRAFIRFEVGLRFARVATGPPPSGVGEPRFGDGGSCRAPGLWFCRRRFCRRGLAQPRQSGLGSCNTRNGVRLVPGRADPAICPWLKARGRLSSARGWPRLSRSRAHCQKSNSERVPEPNRRATAATRPRARPNCSVVWSASSRFLA